MMRSGSRMLPKLRGKRVVIPMAYQRVEVITGIERRRHYSDEEKQRLVEEAFRPGVSVTAFARRQGLCPSLLYRWRRRMPCSPAMPPMSDAVPGFVPVALVSEPPAPVATPTVQAGPRSGMIEIDLGHGRCVRVDHAVDAEALRRVLRVLEGR